MKINKPHNFLLLALMAVLSCCSGEDYSDITVSGSSSAAPLSITVTDGGYASLSSGTSTRASEDDYRTVFTEGDQIGIFAVKDGAIVEGISNLRLTAHAATDANAALTWQSADNKTPFNIDGATYYAYYPYKRDLKIAELNPQATNAAGFFAGVVGKWTPATDQSTYAKYTAQDLMIAKGVLTPTTGGSGKSLSFSMRHQMSLVVIDLPFINYNFTNLSGPSSGYIIDISDKKFNDFTPYHVENGMYHYLVNPSAGGTLLSGSYTNTGEYGPIRWEFKTKDFAGYYRNYIVDGGSRSKSVNRDHELKAGDFFMKNGSIVAGTKSLTREQKADCIGIVFWVGDATAKDPTLKKDHPDCTHGLVVALKESRSSWQSRSEKKVQDWLNVHRPDKYLSVWSGTGSEDPLNNIQGYNNTKAIEEFNMSVVSQDQVRAVWDIVSYRAAVSAPVSTSDWYLPSTKELTLLCGTDVDNIWATRPGKTNRGLIDHRLLYSLGSPFATPLFNLLVTTKEECYYWSSTEYSIEEAFSVDFGSDGRVECKSKSSSALVRAILAF